MNDFFALPPFKAAEALVQLRRQLRDWRPLVEREVGGVPGFEIAGQRVIELVAGDATIEARLARKPARTPDWQVRTLKSSADVRQWQDEVKRRLTDWTDDT